MATRDRVVIRGAELEDYDFDVSRIAGECVTVYMKKTDWEREMDEKYETRSWITETYFIGHVYEFEPIEGDDEYRCLNVHGTGVIHKILLGWIDRVEV